MSATSPEIRAARAFLVQHGVKAVSPQKFANSAKEMDVGFRELLRILGLIYDGSRPSMAREQALDEGSLGKLLARHEALMRCIDEVAQRVPDTVRPHLQSAQTRILQNLPMALLPYHAAMDQYNAAVAQAPARWLAARVGLRPALPLQLPARPGGTP